MLIVTRKAEEGVILTMPDGGLIRVTLLTVGEGGCRVGITAPDDVEIKRSELRTVPRSERAEWKRFGERARG